MKTYCGLLRSRLMAMKSVTDPSASMNPPLPPIPQRKLLGSGVPLMMPPTAASAKNKTPSKMSKVQSTAKAYSNGRGNGLMGVLDCMG